MISIYLVYFSSLRNKPNNLENKVLIEDKNKKKKKPYTVYLEFVHLE